MLKKTIAALGLQLAMITCSMEGADADVDGKMYSRTFVTEPLFGQPGGTRTHALIFRDGKVSDNGGTFFGNPPETFTYRVEGAKVILERVENGTTQDYVTYLFDSASKTLSNEAGATFEWIHVIGKSYQRTFVTEPIFGQPGGEKIHSLSFTEDTVTDNANTFFGNPPETKPYKLDGDIVIIDGVQKYRLATNGSNLTGTETDQVLHLAPAASTN